MRNHWITIDGKRYNLASMTDLGIDDADWGTGIKLEAVYLMPKAKKLIVETYSIWENPRTHGCYGTSYSLVDPGSDDGAMFCERLERVADGEAREKLVALLPDGGI